MRRIALIGLHGSGKGAVGRILQGRGYSHWSIGDIRRRLISRDPVDELPALLVAAVRRTKAGEPLAASALRAILSAAQTQRLCVIDGIPDGVEHVACFGADWRFLHLQCPEPLRQERLKKRSIESHRLWLDGVDSPRDRRLDETLAALPASTCCTIENDSDIDALRSRVDAALRSFSLTCLDAEFH